MINFWSKKRKDKLILAFDIGSYSVGASMFYVKDKESPEIVFSAREQIAMEKKIDVDKFLYSAIKSLEIVCEKAYMKKLGAPDFIHCVMSSPWYMSETRIVKMERKTPFVFTEKFADDLIQKEISILGEEFSQKYKNTDGAVRPIELKNIRTVLNGYETSNPIGQKANELEMDLFISVSPEHILNKIENTIAKHFNPRNIKFSSFMLSTFAVIRDLYSDQDSFLLIDVDGEVTDISMVKKNTLKESISFPLGFNFVLREISSFLNVSFAEARSMISLIKDGHASEEQTKKMNDLLKKLRFTWLTSFQESLANISDDVSIPATIYITILDKDLFDFFCQAIETEQLNQYTLTESKFKINKLGTENLSGTVVFSDGVTRDPKIIINSFFINRFLHKNNLLIK